MVNLKNPLTSLEARGTIGKAISFLQRRKTKIAEKKPIPRDAKTSEQLAWRTMYQLCADLWHTLTAVEKQTWQSAASPHHLTGYQWYMSQCLRPNPGIYLPLAGGTMTGAIEMNGQHVHGLPAPALPNDASRKVYVDNSIATDIHGPARHTDATRYKFIGAGDMFIADGAFTSLDRFSVVEGAANLNQPVTRVTFKVPDDFVSFDTIKALWASAPAAGNM